jgi:hypothetical protein
MLKRQYWFVWMLGHLPCALDGILPLPSGLHASSFPFTLHFSPVKGQSPFKVDFLTGKARERMERTVQFPLDTFRDGGSKPVRLSPRMLGTPLVAMVTVSG